MLTFSRLLVVVAAAGGAVVVVAGIENLHLSLYRLELLLPSQWALEVLVGVFLSKELLETILYLRPLPQLAVGVVAGIPLAMVEMVVLAAALVMVAVLVLLEMATHQQHHPPKETMVVTMTQTKIMAAAVVALVQ
jgi:hypothetical protein